MKENKNKKYMITYPEFLVNVFHLLGNLDSEIKALVDLLVKKKIITKEEFKFRFIEELEKRMEKLKKFVEETKDE